GLTSWARIISPCGLRVPLLSAANAYPSTPSRPARSELLLTVPVLAVLLLDLNIQALDFLVQGGEWNAEAVGGFGLVPPAFFQHIADDAAFAVFNDFEERGVRALFHDGKLAAAANEIVGQQFHGEVWPRCQYHGALDHVFQFAHIARPVILQQRTQGFGSYAQRQALILFGKLGDEVRHQD